jgi:hypothetical protein
VFIDRGVDSMRYSTSDGFTSSHNSSPSDWSTSTHALASTGAVLGRFGTLASDIRGVDICVLSSAVDQVRAVIIRTGGHVSASSHLLSWHRSHKHSDF